MKNIFHSFWRSISWWKNRKANKSFNLCHSRRLFYLQENVSLHFKKGLFYCFIEQKWSFFSYLVSFLHKGFVIFSSEKTSHSSHLIIGFVFYSWSFQENFSQFFQHEKSFICTEEFLQEKHDCKNCWDCCKWIISLIREVIFNWGVIFFGRERESLKWIFKKENTNS